MPTGSVTPAGGGTAFNGGTITNDLHIAPSADTGTTLNLDIAAGQTNDVLDVNGSSGALFVLSDGGVVISEPSTSTDALALNQHSGTPGNLLNVAQNFNPFATLLRIQKDGALGIQVHAAPADANVATGECVLWFDQTNGASKLMVKGKSANGTVVAASIALA